MLGQWGRVCLIVILACFSYIYSATIGGYAQDLFDYGIGSRGLSLAGACRTTAHDATAGYWNSGLLGNIVDLNIAYMATSLMGETKYNYLGSTVPLGGLGTFAVNYYTLKMDSLEIHSRDSAPNSTPDGYFNVENSALMISYGRPILMGVQAGITTKYASRKVYDHSDGVLALDAGVVWDLDALKIGGNLRNIYAMQFGDESSDEYGLDVDMGMSYRWGQFLFALDTSRWFRGNDIKYHAGVEYDMLSLDRVNGVKIRAGINSNELALGVGFSLLPLAVDYAYLIREYSNEHVFSFNLHFDDNSRRLRIEQADKFYKQAYQAVNNHDLEQATLLINKGLQEYEEHIELKKIKYRIQQVKPYLDLTVFSQGQVHAIDLYKDSIYGFIVQNYDLALENVEYLLYKYKKQELMLLRNLIETESHKIYPYRDKNFIPMIVEEAMAALMVDDLQKSNTMLEKVVYLEPDNVLVLKRLGSNYYTQKRYDDALRYWNRVLDIKPGDQEVKNMINKLKRER